MKPRWTVLPALLLIASLPALAASGAASDDAHVRTLLLPNADIDALRALGPEVLPALARIYEGSTEDERAVIAWAFYGLGWKSPDAKRVLMRDVHTAHQNLRLQVQWALGRVAGDRDVVDTLLDNMRSDDNPLFRDKAACALAHDQIHLTEQQKIHLYQGLIEALRDPEAQVRGIAVKALEIHTGQTKGFRAGGDAEQRERSVKAWETWLAEYRSNL